MATIKPTTYRDDGKGPTIDKDPDAVLDYSQDWGPWLQNVSDTIVSHEIVAEDGLTVESSANDATTVTAWVSGGIAGKTQRLTFRVTTADGRTDDRSVFLKILER
ncbi:hypothetical protein [Xenophilus sp. Marseille-Q4582]|uniref:phage fiber-tail adaptor protein n=1 Tax=Xenophilus sp. Marseille-Q4582 TaxID=2866600 RepID=UPI001CE3DD21|nr:hypothetical protein [Xenophilus sp. Marseille-Q4582]